MGFYFWVEWAYSMQWTVHVSSTWYLYMLQSMYFKWSIFMDCSAFYSIASNHLGSIVYSSYSWLASNSSYLNCISLSGVHLSATCLCHYYTTAIAQVRWHLWHAWYIASSPDHTHLLNSSCMIDLVIVNSTSTNQAIYRAINAPKIPTTSIATTATADTTSHYLHS